MLSRAKNTAKSEKKYYFIRRTV